ncbi:MAG TPA: biotin-dependent carboxyltransferase family protein [Gammaproteobacteria bacterium]|nr:biotin-dependent carboxyltransferase family protein [Gammaproteobacteria bacterium]
MITVIDAGPLSTVQDLGRQSYGNLGLPRAGAADGMSLRVANRLVGNADEAAALEMTVRGAALRFETGTAVALAGARTEATLDGEPVPMYQSLLVRAGATLRIGRITEGWRTYLAVAGGIGVPPVLGSRSSDTLSGLGPAPLVAGNRLPVAPFNLAEGFYLRSPPRFPQEVRLRVLPGPHDEWFTENALQTLVGTSCRVSAQSDRSGLRLEGMALPRARQEELSSAGMTVGAIQVTGGGLPIVLLPNHGSTGGYPVIATVISADIPMLGQLGPGNSIRFTLVTRDAALKALRERERRLQQDIVGADAGLLAARALMMLAGRHPSLKQAVMDDGKRRLRIRRGD